MRGSRVAGRRRARPRALDLRTGTHAGLSSRFGRRRDSVKIAFAGGARPRPKATQHFESGEIPMKRQLSLSIGAALLGVSATAFAVTDTETTASVPFNLANPGARSMGLGGAFLGSADD